MAQSFEVGDEIEYNSDLQYEDPSHFHSGTITKIEYFSRYTSLKIQGFDGRIFEHATEDIKIKRLRKSKKDLHKNSSQNDEHEQHKDHGSISINEHITFVADKEYEGTIIGISSDQTMIQVKLINGATEIFFMDEIKIKYKDDNNDTKTIKPVQLLKSILANNITYSKYFTKSALQQISCKKAHKSTQCFAIQRIIIILKLYHKNKFNDDKFVDLINNIYYTKHLLNDYIHVMEEHYNLFETIYNSIAIQCSLDKCSYVQRNQRNCSRFSNNEEKLNSNNNALAVENVLCGIIDQLHSYFLHSVDIGFRLTEKEKKLLMNNANNETHTSHTSDNDQNTFVKMTNMLRKRQKEYEQFNHASNRIYNKFVTNASMMNEQKSVRQIPAQQHEIKNNDEKQQTNEINDNDQKQQTLETAYHFSYRFYYWIWYKDNNNTDNFLHPQHKYCDLYVPARFEDLKQELLINNRFPIDSNLWIEVLQKASQYYKTDKIKQFVSHEIPAFHYNCNKTVTLYHLVAIMLYTDYDQLSYEFSKTFRFDSSTKYLAKLIEKHSNFYWMARYMREMIECFGAELDSNLSVYHGISQLMVFSSTVALFNHPTSTTYDIVVAANFATHHGIILELTNSHRFCAPCLNCQWISRYAYENEVLFIGGWHSLNVINIIECSNGNQYKPYLTALNKLIDTMSGHNLFENVSLRDKKILNGLVGIFGQKTEIPKYIGDLFAKYKMEKKRIVVDLHSVSLSPYFSEMLLSDENVIDLNKVCKLFQDCELIIIQNMGSTGNCTFLTSSYIASICSILNTTKLNDVGHLKTVIIKNVRGSGIKTMKNSFWIQEARPYIFQGIMYRGELQSNIDLAEQRELKKLAKCVSEETVNEFSGTIIKRSKNVPIFHNSWNAQFDVNTYYDLCIERLNN